VLHSIKKKLTKCRRGDLKKFRYGSLLVSFFLERVPIFRLQVEWNLLGPRDPRMLRWCQLMARHVAGPIVKYDDIFFDWLQIQMLMVDYYSYAGLDFRGDPDLALPEDAQWGDLGKKYMHFFLFKCFFEFLSYSNVIVLYIYLKTNTKCLLLTQMLDRIDLLELLLSNDEEM
jgi:hypothetical protein